MRDRAGCHNEIIRRMAEPKHLADLRAQKERIEHERREVERRANYEMEADRLRREIEAMGEKPCA